MTTGKVKFAIVGMGHIGKRHAKMIEDNPDAELIAVCDVRPPEETGWNNAGVPYFSDFTEMLNGMDGCDVVNICTPNGLHASQATAALERKKHVVIEKPMALSRADGEKIIFKALQVSRHVFVVMQNRYSPPSAWLKEVIEKNIAGKIYFVQLNCFWNRDDRYYLNNGWHGTAEMDGGTLFTQFSHFIDMLYWLFGDITDIKAGFNDFAHQHSTDFEDSGSVIFRFVNGGMGNINFSTAVWDRNLESTMTIIGEKGTIKVSGQYMNEVTECNIKGYDMPELPPSNPPNDYGYYKGSAANHQYVIDNVIQTLQERTYVTTNALEGLKVVDIIERIYQQK
ncbi:Gfo/Idh/MocA family protein [Anaerophaga thermohalophila]|jgi:predicted dehydrogenase|uniref:Gfo/Idh/MocA family protein n=1 Tax=Anaerophaga thermohalophila TaxID=177400 RepID=UPI0002E7F5EC|nr:Gfo/Idh/MocA family oxidoreductase [Anaerophaga thermohalophila]